MPDCLPTVAEIIDDIAGYVGVTAINTEAVAAIEVRGFKCSGRFNAADAIRTLQRAYFFDMPEIDGVITCVLRGGAVAATINRSDMAKGQEAKFETAREQGFEFPNKLHISYANAESDYTPTKQTSERRSADISSLSEITIEIPINFTDDQAAQVADKAHKTAWVEHEGRLKVGVPEKFAFLTPSDLISVEIDSSVFKQFRIQPTTTVDGVIQIEGVRDRGSSTTSDRTAPTPIDPPTPVTNLPSQTTWEVMDLPALAQTHDTLHLYFAGHGDADTPWNGAIIERLIDTDWVEVGQFTFPTTMGVTVDETVADHDAGLDTTNDILVLLSDDDIATITQAQFDIGGNAALLGDEIVNFKTVVAEGDNYRLSYLTRGGLNTTTTSHAIGSRFVLLQSPTRVQLGSFLLNDTLTFRVFSFGTLPQASDEDTIVFTGQSQTEWTPLNPTKELLDDDWLIGWDHYERIGQPNDTVISQHFELFRVQFIEGATTLTLDSFSESLTLSDAEQLFFFGALVADFDSILIYPRNEYTGLGLPATPIDITGDSILLEDGSGVILLQDGSGSILLE